MNFNKIPDKLKTQALWCVWKQGKIPCNPRTGKNAQSNIPETFSDFETACNALEKGQYEGLGINIHNGFSAIDIDHCIGEKENYLTWQRILLQKWEVIRRQAPVAQVFILFSLCMIFYLIKKHITSIIKKSD